MTIGGVFVHAHVFDSTWYEGGEYIDMFAKSHIVHAAQEKKRQTPSQTTASGDHGLVVDSSSPLLTPSGMERRQRTPPPPRARNESVGHGLLPSALAGEVKKAVF